MSCSWAAAVDHRCHVLAAGLEVLDRAPQPSRQLRGEQVLGVERRLRTEAAADVRRDDAHFLLREPEHLRELVALVVRGLRGRVEGEAAGLPVGDAHRGLHGHRGAALVAQVDGEPVRRGGELGLGVVGGELLLQHEVGREAVEDGCGGLGGRRREGGHDGQLLVVDDHGRGGVGRQVGIGGDDHGDGLADEVHLPLGQARSLDAGQRPARRQARQVVVGPHAEHAGQRCRFGRVDRDDARVGEVAACIRHVQRARQVDVVDEPPASGEQSRILLADHRGADHRAHVRTSSLRRTSSAGSGPARDARNLTSVDEEGQGRISAGRGRSRG